MRSTSAAGILNAMIAVINPKTKQRLDDDSHVLFWNASWETYESILKDYAEIPQRINFDNGVLELMTLSAEHAQYSRFLASLVVQLSVDRGIKMASRGSNTLKQMRKFKGLETDECFYVSKESKIRGKARLDMSVDPPPDLVIEVDITHHTVDREAIYAEFGVPEMWKFDGKKLIAYALVRGSWKEIDKSVAFPFLKPSELTPFLKKLKKNDETSVLTEYRDWLGILK